MKIYSWNVNGLRAVHNKGALTLFIEKEDPDILLLQEIKVKENQLPDELQDGTFFRLYNPAEKAGYSGVAIWVHARMKEEVATFSKGMPEWDDREGRVAQCLLKDNTVIISVYVPNGGKSETAYQEKLTFFTSLSKYVKELQTKGCRVIVGGDFNVARSELDLPDVPEKFLEHTHFNFEVRGHMETLIESGLVDSYRSRNEDEEGAYSYWDNFSFSLPRGIKPRDVNKGWRLDYILVDQETNANIQEAAIKQQIFGSDHCPVSITI